MQDTLEPNRAVQCASSPDMGRSAIVLGCGELGSAVAHRLHREGFAIVLIDAIDPPWAHRGRSFTDAWYLGVCELEGVAAVFCASVRSIPSVLDRGRAIAATTWSWPGVASALQPDALIDARGCDTEIRPPTSCTARPFTIAISAQRRYDADATIPIAPAPARDVVRLEAPLPGRFATGHRIGDRVRAGDLLGAVQGEALIAPCDGYLCALTARGARVAARTLLVEIDPQGSHAGCFGIEVGERTMAAAVFDAIEQRESRCAEARWAPG